MPINESLSAETATTAIVVSPAQQPSITASAAARPPTGQAPADIDPDLLAIADELAPKLRECVINSIGWKIMLAARLREYRDQMCRSDWGQVLKSRRLGVGSPRTVQMLVRVGGQKVFRDSSKLALLPDAVTVLNELAGLSAHVLTTALSDGTIGPETSLKEAKHFVVECRGRSTASDSNPQHA